MTGAKKASQEKANSGFTLLEVLVALALTASVLISILALGRYQRHSERVIKVRAEIVSQAETLLNQWLTTPQLQPGHYKEDTGGGRVWSVSVKRVSTQVSSTTNVSTNLISRAGVLWQVEVCCTWRIFNKDKKLCFQGVSITPPHRGRV